MGEISAEAADYHYGWKAFMNAEINNETGDLFAAIIEAAKTGDNSLQVLPATE